MLCASTFCDRNDIAAYQTLIHLECHSIFYNILDIEQRKENCTKLVDSFGSNRNGALII
jgi:hypothetical protein